MLRGMIIGPDSDLNERLTNLLDEIGIVKVTRALEQYPNTLELLRFVRAHAPQVIFLGMESAPKAIAVACDVEKNVPGAQLVAVSRACQPQTLLEVMRAGIRELVWLPFDRQTMTECLLRIKAAAPARPPASEATDDVYSFLPAKPGVGATTIAMNTAAALARLPETSVLLSDFDLSCGMLHFMIKLDSPHCVTDAMEHAHEMDESLWASMVSHVDHVDVLHAGKLNPNCRVEAAQIRHLMEFVRRKYEVLCFDLSGNFERYSLEIMHESKRIFVVSTPEKSSLELAREKLNYLKQLDLIDRVNILISRHPQPAVAADQTEALLGFPVRMSFPNDYHRVQKAVLAGRFVGPGSALGKQFSSLANSLLEGRPAAPVAFKKKRFVHFFSADPDPETSTALVKYGK